MTRLLRSAALLCFISFPVLAAAAPEPAAQTPPRQPAKIRPKAVRQQQHVQPMLVVLSEDALLQAVSAMLPLPLEHQGGQQFQGDLSVDSIDSLSVDNGRIIVSGQLSGSNMSMNADVGGQSIHVRLGSLALPVVCEAALRFDQARQTLLITPSFRRARAGGAGDADEALLALLNGLSKPHEVALRDLMPLSGRIGATKVHLRIELLELRAEDGAITLRLRPAAAKKRP